MKVDTGRGYVDLAPPIVELHGVKYAALIARAQNPRITLDRDTFLCTWVDLHYRGGGGVQGFGGNILESIDSAEAGEYSPLASVAIMNMLDVFQAYDYAHIAGKWVYGLKEYKEGSSYGPFLDGIMSIDTYHYFIPKRHFAPYIPKNDKDG